MLSARVYKAYYELARVESRHSVIELGTGQGASSIALTAGIVDSGRCARLLAVDQFSQQNKGPHPASISVDGAATSDINLAAYRKNLHDYGLDQWVDVYPGKTTEVEIPRDEKGPFDVLVIDIDGYVDRDLALFYDWIEPNGLIVIDDYRNTVSNLGKRNLDKFRRMPRGQVEEKIAALSHYQRGRLLGKQMLTWRLVERMKAMGLLRPVRNIDGTLVCRKIGTGSFGSRFTEGASRGVEDGVVRDFLHLMVVGKDQLSISSSLAFHIRAVGARVLKGQ